MSDSTSSRRDFLRNALSVIVVASASPLTVLGRITPTIHVAANGEVAATYVIFLNDYQALQPVGGSVKLADPKQLLLNPDQISRGFTGKKFPIAVTHVIEDGPSAFVSVSTYCTHGFDYQVDDYNPVTQEFVCPHRHSTFKADGTHVVKPSTPDVGNLRSFPTVYDAEAGTITINGVLTVADVATFSEPPSDVFLDQNHPNPFNPSTIIRYGLPSTAHVLLTVHALDGTTIATLVDAQQAAGVYAIDFSANDVPSGTYFYRLTTPVGTLTRRMVVRK